jgi:NDP-sugar pyrophosphorylase family protein
MVTVAGRPFIHYLLGKVARDGAHRVVMCVGHHGEQVERAVGTGDRWGIEVVYSYDGEEPLGTGGALLKALPMLGGLFLVIYGDTYNTVDLSDVEDAYLRCGQPTMMSVYRNRGRMGSSNVAFRDGMVTAFDRSNQWPVMEYIDAGITALAKITFDHSGERFDLNEMLRIRVKQNAVAAYEIPERFPYYDMGTPEFMVEAQKFLAGSAEGDRDGT